MNEPSNQPNPSTSTPEAGAIVPAGSLDAETALDASASPRHGADQSDLNFIRTIQKRQSMRKRMLIALPVAAILVGGFVGFNVYSNSSKPALRYEGPSVKPQDVSLTNLSNRLNNASAKPADKLTVNGQVVVGGSLVLESASRPTNPVAGQIFYDKGANTLAYFNGTDFVNLAGNVVNTQVTNNYITAPINNLTNVTNNNVSNITNVNNITNVTNVTGGGLAGSGTVGAIAVFTAANTLGDSVISQSGANLTITGTAAFQNGADSTTAFQIQDSAGTSNLFVADTLNNRIDIGSGAPLGVHFEVNGTARVNSWLNAGSIYSTHYERGDGNGTMIDLELNGPAIFSNKVPTDDNVLQVVRGSTVQTADLVQFQDSTNAVLAGVTGTGGLYTYDTIGVGTNNPEGDLEIRRDALNASGATLTLSNKAADPNGNATVQLNFAVDDSESLIEPNARLQVLNRNLSGNNDADFIFSNWAGSSFDETLRIEGQTGNVGIGVVDPSEKLHLDGKIRFISPLEDDLSGNAKIFVGQGPDTDADGTLGAALTEIQDYGDTDNGIIFQYGGVQDAGGMKLTDDGLTIWGAGDERLLRVYNEDVNVEVLTLDDTGTFILLNHGIITNPSLELLHANATDGFEMRIGQAGGQNIFMGIDSGANLTTGVRNTATGTGALESLTTGSFNTALGTGALADNTIGFDNTAIGELAMQSNVDGDRNVAVGVRALEDNVAGNNNVALGFYTLRDNTANDNTAVGTWALEFNTTGGENAALGIRALNGNITGSFNSAFGESALRDNTNGNHNSAFGEDAMIQNEGGDDNVAVGAHSLQTNVNGNDNTAIGSHALLNNTASGVTAVGAYALHDNTTGIFNTAVGYDSLRLNTTGSYNSAFGQDALYANTGSDNTGIGSHALAANTTGNGNTALGSDAADALTTGNDNTAIGFNALASNDSGDNNTALGSSALVFSTGYYNVAVGAGALSAITTGSSNTAIGTDAGNIDNDTFRTLAGLNNATVIGIQAQAQASNSLILGGQGGNAVNVGIGTTIPLNTFSVMPIYYDTGTASQAGNTVTGVGTAFDSTMLFRQFIFANGATGTITAVNSATDLTLSTSQAVASMNYRIHHYGLQVTSDGRVGVGTPVPGYGFEVRGESNFQSVADSTTAFQIQNATAAALFKADTQNMELIIDGNLVNYGRLAIGSDPSVWLNDTITGVTNGAEATDGYIWVPVHSGSVSDLRLYIADDDDDAFSIWGNTCATDCDELDSASQVAHFQADGYISLSNAASLVEIQGDSNIFGNLYVAGNAGIMMPAADKPMITNGWDQFTSGAYDGLGRWGMFMEPSTLTLGVPNEAGNGNFQFARYNDDSTIASIPLHIDDTGVATFQNAADSESAFRVMDADGGTPVLNVDTVNNSVGINTDVPAVALDVYGSPYDAANNFRFNISAMDWASPAQGAGGGIGFGGYADQERYFGVIQGFKESATANNYAGGLRFYTRTDGQGNLNQQLQIASNGATLYKNSADSATAFQIQDTANTALFLADTQDKVIKISGTNTTFTTLELDNAHFKLTQSTAPTINTPANCGTAPSAAVTAGSTDNAGSFTITTGTGGTSSTCDLTISFQSNFSAAPKLIIVVGKDSAASAQRQIYVSNPLAGSFDVSFATSAGGANSTTYSFSYWIVE